MIFICKTCGRRRVDDWGNSAANLCHDPTHEGKIAVSDNQARDLAEAAKAYHKASGVEDRATAFNDWLEVLTEGLPTVEHEQIGMQV